MIGFMGSVVPADLQASTNSTAPPIFPWSVIAVALKPSSLALVAYAFGDGKASCIE